MTKWLVAVGFLVLNLYIYYFMARDAVVPPRDSFASFPLQLGDWRCAQNEPLPPDIKVNLGATDTLVCQYEREKLPRNVGVYLGYHATQVREEGGGSAENAIHPPAHCLPGSGWDIVDSRTVELASVGIPAEPGWRAKRLVIAKGKQRQLVYYWYQLQGRAVAEDWQKILYVGYDRATRGRTDGALVRFTIPLARDEDSAEAAFRDIAPRVVDLLSRYVPV
jgi:EpsI family protein